LDTKGINVISQESLSKTKRHSAFKLRHVYDIVFIGRARQVYCASQYIQTASSNSKIVPDKILVGGTSTELPDFAPCDISVFLKL